VRVGRRFTQAFATPSSASLALAGRAVTVEGTTAPGGNISTTSQSSVTQFGITITFNGSYPVGQFVNGDYFVLPNGPTYPQVTAVSPAYIPADGRHGITVNPIWSGANGWRAIAGYNGGSGTQYEASLNVALNLPYQLTAGDAFMPSIGSTNLQHSANRPYLERVIVLTCLSSSPSIGSFRPPYVQGSTKTLYNTSDIDWDVLPNVEAPASAPSWASVSNTVNRGPWIRTSTSNQNYRLIQPALQMSEYGRNIANDMGQVLLRLCTNGTQAEKQSTLYGAIQIGIDFYAIMRRQVDTGYSNTYGLGLWGQWSGGHSIGNKDFVFLCAAVMPTKTEFADACAHNPAQYWGPDGQCYFKAERDAAGASTNAVNWMERYFGYDSSTVAMGERPFGAVTNTTLGLPGYTFGSGVESTPPVPAAGYDNSYHQMNAASARNLALAAQLMDKQDVYGWEPTLIMAEVFANGPENGGGTGTNGPSFSTFQRDMWVQHYVNQYT
jgi:hypothetical protein